MPAQVSEADPAAYIINPLLYVGLDWRQAWKPPVTKQAGCHSLGFAQ